MEPFRKPNPGETFGAYKKWLVDQLTTKPLAKAADEVAAKRDFLLYYTALCMMERDFQKKFKAEGFKLLGGGAGETDAVDPVKLDTLARELGKNKVISKKINDTLSVNSQRSFLDQPELFETELQQQAEFSLNHLLNASKQEKLDLLQQKYGKETDPKKRELLAGEYVMRQLLWKEANEQDFGNTSYKAQVEYYNRNDKFFQDRRDELMKTEAFREAAKKLDEKTSLSGFTLDVLDEQKRQRAIQAKRQKEMARNAGIKEPERNYADLAPQEDMVRVHSGASVLARPHAPGQPDRADVPRNHPVFSSEQRWADNAQKLLSELNDAKKRWYHGNFGRDSAAFTEMKRKIRAAIEGMRAYAKSNETQVPRGSEAEKQAKENA